MDTLPMTSSTQSFFDEFDAEVEKFLETKKLKFLVEYRYEVPDDLVFSDYEFKEKQDNRKQIVVVVKEKNNGRKKGKKIF